jgi:hypothetical protein
MNLEFIRTALEKAGVTFEVGLTSQEIKDVEQRFGFTFPEDLRSLLMFALPTNLGFPNWRNQNDPELERSLSGPLEGMWFDVQNGVFWPDEWGSKPKEPAAAYEQLRSRVASAPTLIPICGHRYMPDRPYASGNPVFSVHQTDIIYYGSDLENYLHNEFHYYFGKPVYSISGEIREIEFWSLLAR